MNTDDLSNETYEAVIIEAECFHHNLTLHLGLLADDCDTENEYLDAAEKLVKKIMKAKPHQLEDYFFGEVDDFSGLPAALEMMFANIASVREIPEEKRTYELCGKRNAARYNECTRIGNIDKRPVRPTQRV